MTLGDLIDLDPAASNYHPRDQDGDKGDAISGRCTGEIDS